MQRSEKHVAHHHGLADAHAEAPQLTLVVEARATGFNLREPLERAIDSGLSLDPCCVAATVADDLMETTVPIIGTVRITRSLTSRG